VTEGFSNRTKNSSIDFIKFLSSVHDLSISTLLVHKWWNRCKSCIRSLQKQRRGCRKYVVIQVSLLVTDSTTGLRFPTAVQRPADRPDESHSAQSCLSCSRTWWKLQDNLTGFKVVKTLKRHRLTTYDSSSNS